MIEHIPPTSDRGTGLVLPLAKGMAHLMTVYHAGAREWPMTIAEAAGELTEAMAHFNDISYDPQIITGATNDALNEWKRQVQELSNDMRQRARDNADLPLTEYGNEAIRLLAVEAWTVLTITDREITGLSPADTDPGRQP